MQKQEDVPQDKPQQDRDHATPSDHSGRAIDVGELLFSSAGTKWTGFPLTVHRLHPNIMVRDAVQVSPMAALCLSGRADMQTATGHHEHRAISSEGAMVLSGRGLEYDSFSWSGATEVLTIGMDTTRLAGAVDADRFSPDFAPMHRFLIRDTQLAALMHNMLAETRAGCPAGALYGESLSMALASYVTARYAIAEPGTQLKPTLSRSQMRAVRDYVRVHLADDISLHDLARLTHLSISHFSQLFKNSCALSPHQFVIRERAAEALRLLSSGRMPITEIAQQTGFADQSHLTKVLRRVANTTPQRYRASHRSVAGYRM